MKKNMVKKFFVWWLSIHPMNVTLCENWLTLESVQKNPGKTAAASERFLERMI